MGSHYGSIQIRSTDTDLLKRELESLAVDGKARFYIGPPINGWIGVYPTEHGHSADISAEIAKRFPGDIIHLIVHHDVVFYYLYYSENSLIDEYCSAPD